MKFVIILLAVLLAGTFAVSESQSAFGISNGKIAFDSNRDGNYSQIYTMDSDGSNQKNISNDTINEYYPLISPDGTKVGFIFGDQSGQQKGIGFMNVDGTNKKYVTINSYILGASGTWTLPFSWSSDSSKIVTTAYDGVGFPRYRLYVINADGSGNLLITGGQGAPLINGGSWDPLQGNPQPEWSPTGNVIAFVSGYGYVIGSNITLTNSNDGGLTDLTNTGWQGWKLTPRWSPDGSKIAYINQNLSSPGYYDVVVMNSDGSGKRTIPLHIFQSYVYYLSWSPDGTKFAYICVTGNTYDIYGICITNSDGSGTPRILYNETQPNNLYFVNPPNWSSDSKQLVVGGVNTTSATYDIYVINEDGSDLHKLTNTPGKANGNPDWWGPANPKLPIIILPGIGGTELNNVYEEWPGILTGGPNNKLALQSDGITPWFPDSNIKVGNVLDSFPTNYYGSLEDYLVSKGYTKGVDLFTFPYDWRLDNAGHVPELGSLVNEAINKSGSDKVILVAHSTGGLIAKKYITSDPANAAKVQALITMGTPYGGAAKAYFGLSSGYDFGNPLASQNIMKFVAHNAPNPYQLSPRTPFIYDNGKAQDLSVSWSLKFKQLTPDGNSVHESSDNSWTFNQGLVTLANQFFDASFTGPFPKTVHDYTLIGTGVKTLTSFDVQDYAGGLCFHWGCHSYVQFGDRKVVLDPHLGDGDGTVPEPSADNINAQNKLYIQYQKDDASDHGDLANSKRVQSLIGQIIDAENAGTTPHFDSQYTSYHSSANLFQAESTDFTLHSDAHLKIVDETGNGTIGFNQNGTIDEDPSVGSFLSTDDGEYASVNDPSHQYRVYVNGTQDGNFTLTVGQKQLGQSKSFSYLYVPVNNSTVAQLNVIPNQFNFTALPSLNVTSNNGTYQVIPQPPLIEFCGKPFSSFDSIINGTNNSEVLVGTGGNDLILGNGGDDRIFGQAGNDCIIAGNGTDYISGGDGNDTIFAGAGDDKIWGGAGDDTIFAGDGNDKVVGGPGNDILDGENGNDTIWGQGGNDTIDGGSGTNTCIDFAGNNTATNCETYYH